MKTNDALDRLAFVLRSHLRSQRIFGSEMARRLEVAPPTLARMLDAGREGAGGVCLRTWCRALKETGHLEPLVSGLEDHLKARDHQFVPVPLEAKAAPDDTALLRIGHVLRQAIRTSRISSARQLAMTIGVTQPTIATLLGKQGPHAGGSAIKCFLRAAAILELSNVVEQTLPEPSRLYTPPAGGSTGAYLSPS